MTSFKAGERIWNNERMWNLGNGLPPQTTRLPQRLLTEPIKTGPAKGEVNRLGEMLPEYDRLRGWDERSADRVQARGTVPVAASSKS